MPLLSGGRGRYFRGLIGGQKINVTFGGTATFGILRYLDVNWARGGIFDCVSAYPRIHFKIYLEVSLAKSGIFDCVSTYPLQKILRRFYGEGWYFRLRVRVSTSKYTLKFPWRGVLFSTAHPRIRVSASKNI